MIPEAAIWREDVDALAFGVFVNGEDHGAPCMVHRRAFRALTRLDPASPQDCLSFFAENVDAFREAAERKILDRKIPKGRSLNLNSRDIRRAMGTLSAVDGDGRGKTCRVLSGQE